MIGNSEHTIGRGNAQGQCYFPYQRRIDPWSSDFRGFDSCSVPSSTSLLLCYCSRETPTPALPLPPPPPSPPTPWRAVLELTASGAVDDYTPEVREEIKAKFAAVAQVNKSFDDCPIYRLDEIPLCP